MLESNVNSSFADIRCIDNFWPFFLVFHYYIEEKYILFNMHRGSYIAMIPQTFTIRTFQSDEDTT